MLLQASGMVEDTSQKPDAQGSERWQQVANSLALTQNQVLSLVALRKSMRSRCCPQLTGNRRAGRPKSWETEELTIPSITLSSCKRSSQLWEPEPPRQKLLSVRANLSRLISSELCNHQSASLEPPPPGISGRICWLTRPVWGTDYCAVLQFGGG